MIIREYYKQHLTIDLTTYRKMDKFLDIHKEPKFTQEEIDKLIALKSFSL